MLERREAHLDPRAHLRHGVDEGQVDVAHDGAPDQPAPVVLRGGGGVKWSVNGHLGHEARPRFSS